MKWNPLFDAWALLRLDLAYAALLRAAPRPLAWLLWQVPQGVCGGGGGGAGGFGVGLGVRMCFV